MSHSRIAIRREVIHLLNEHFPDPVYAQREPDLSDDNTAINVYFSEGESEYEQLYLSTTANFIIGLHRKELSSDDELDVWAASVSEVIHLHNLAHVVTGIIETGFEYGGDESAQHSSVYLQYSVIYHGK